jgi:MSHA biogenesis protein MshO
MPYLDRRNKAFQNHSNAEGFTLIELVMVIIILSIVSVGVGNLIGVGTQAYVDTAERDEILSKSRYSVERLNRGVRNALPNSIRIEAYEPSGQVVKSHCLEFFPIEWSTFYLNINDSASGYLEGPDMVSALNDARAGYDETNEQDHYIVVYPTNADQIYVSAAEIADAEGRIVGLNDVRDSGTSGVKHVELDNIISFDEESTADRFYIVSQPVSYCIDYNGGAYDLYLVTDYGILEEQSANVDYLTTTLGGTKALMAEDLVNDITDITSSTLDQTTREFDEAPFRIDNANLQRNSIVHTLLMFERNEEVVVFYNETHLRNTP